MRRSLQLLLILPAIVLLGCSGNPAPAPPPEERPFVGPLRSTAQPEQPAAVQETPEANPTAGPAFTEYKVRRGDTLGLISDRYNVNLDDLMKANGLTDPNVLQVGQVLRIPVEVDRVAPADKLLPDSELVYGPAYAGFDVKAFAEKYHGYLASYEERVEGQVLTGPQIIQLVAERFSIGPRVLLAFLEMQGGWVTSTAIGQTQIDYPMGYVDSVRIGLYKQAFRLGSFLNEGYYGKVTGRLTAFEFPDRRRAKLAPRVNPGTAAIQAAFAHQASWENWLNLIGPNGWIATYRKLFGDPAQYVSEPVLPANFQQPTLRLPWEDGHLWYFTGGPHAGWADGSAWAAVDFTPKDQAGSCWTSAEWAIAAGPGRVVQAENGRVVINLAGGTFQGAGWSLLYMHMAKDERVEIGTMVKTGDHIGHPSCEGGAAETSHLHFARLFNGQWIPAADPKVPLVLSGWVFYGDSQEYDGKMVRGSDSHKANDAQVPEQNGVIADGLLK